MDYVSEKNEEFPATLLGDYVLIYKKRSKTLLVSDHIRSIPLFYGLHKGHCFVTDNLNKYQKEHGKLKIDNNKLEEYVASGFVYGNNTIYHDAFGLQAGEMICIFENEIKSKRYFEYKPAKKTFSIDNIYEFSNMLDKAFRSIFSRMIEQTPSVNRWIIPLSGGHDSRIIVNYLYLLGKKNVICFSYGTPNNEQARISKQVAEALNYEWHFTEYTEQKWQQLHEIGIIDEYIRYAFNGVSTPHLQDFLAVYEMNKKGIIKPGDVFVPGHTLDFIAGGHYGYQDIESDNKYKAVKRTYLRHSRIRDSSQDPVRTIEAIYEKANVEPQHFQEYFNWQERQAKFIVNSIRAYEHFGFEARLPFWDKEIVKYWLSIQKNKLIGRNKYFEAEKCGILTKKIVDIPFAGDKKKNLKEKRISKVKTIFPTIFINKALKMTRRKVTLDEGLNQIYTLKVKSVKDLLNPVEIFPENVKTYFQDYLQRFPYQMDYHFLTALYTIRITMDEY
ncbi:MAG: asparagine synthetase B family protein [Acidobacteriota bacterium]|nr:asparagine synthetase B family protein [Acidobacteriota bacterium]